MLKVFSTAEHKCQMSTKKNSARQRSDQYGQVKERVLYDIGKIAKNRKNLGRSKKIAIMPLRIRTNLEWKQKTREGRYVTHFDRIVSIDDLTGAHGLSLGLKFHLKFGTDYRTDHVMEIKVVEGLEVLDTVFVDVKCATGYTFHENFYHPSIEDLEQESGFSQSTDNYCCEYFRDMFKPKNLPRIKDVDVTYSISFDLDLKEVSTGATKQSKLLEKLYKNMCGFRPDKETDELSDVKIYCEDQVFNCHKLILSGQSKVFKTMLSNIDMVEATSGEIKIVDTPADVIIRLLFYIYHEFVEPTMITHDLLVAADKYDIPDLVNICINFMKENLNDQNVVEIMTSAYLTNKKELFRRACKFVFKRGADDQIVQIEAWKEFKEKDPMLANKMLEEAVFKL